MNERKIEEIKQLVFSVVQFVEEQQLPMDQELQTLLAELFDYASLRIIELREQEKEFGEPEVPNLPTPQLEQAPYPSSNINSFKYDPDNETLYVKFHGSDTADSGPTYQYEGVPGFIFDIFAKGSIAPKTSGSNKYHTWIKGVTPSLGASMHALIKQGGFPYQRLTQ